MAGFLQNVIDALSLGSLYALVALGIGLLFGILRLINFAQGDYITIGCYALIVTSTDGTARMLAGAYSGDLPHRAHRRPVNGRAHLPPAAARLFADTDDRVLRRQLHYSERH